MSVRDVKADRDVRDDRDDRELKDNKAHKVPLIVIYSVI